MFLRDWTEDDRNKAIALFIQDARTCKQCGTDPELWNEDKGGHRRAFVAEEHFCPGCEVKEGAEERFRKSQGDGPSKGFSIRLARNAKALFAWEKGGQRVRQRERPQ